MQIAADQLRTRIIKGSQVIDHLLESLIGLLCFQVADVLADEHVRPEGERDRILQMAAYRERGWKLLSERDWHRRITAGSSQHLFPAKKNSHNGIIRMPPDGPVVYQEHVRNPAQTAHCVA